MYMYILTHTHIYIHIYVLETELFPQKPTCSLRKSLTDIFSVSILRAQSVPELGRLIGCGDSPPRRNLHTTCAYRDNLTFLGQMELGRPRARYRPE